MNWLVQRCHACGIATACQSAPKQNRAAVARRSGSTLGKRNGHGQIWALVTRCDLSLGATDRIAAAGMQSFCSRRPGARITANQALKIGNINELISLSAQVIGNHRRLGLQGRYDTDAPAFLLQRRNEMPEIAIAGKQYNMIQMIRKPHRIDGQLDIHISFNFTAAH